MKANPIPAATDIMAGHNDERVTGKLIVQSGGKASVGNILWAANGGSDGIIDVQDGGVLTVAGHLWWGVNGKAPPSPSAARSDKTMASSASERSMPPRQAAEMPPSISRAE
jgi:hypothetical protein